VSLFVLSPEIENRDEVEVGNWVKHIKRPTLNDTILSLNFVIIINKSIKNILEQKERQLTSAWWQIKFKYVRLKFFIKNLCLRDDFYRFLSPNSPSCKQTGSQVIGKES
jgi:hypothetical protein